MCNSKTWNNFKLSNHPPTPTHTEHHVSYQPTQQSLSFHTQMPASQSGEICDPLSPSYQPGRSSDFRRSTWAPPQLHSRHVSPLKILQKTIYSVQNGGFFAITQLWRSCTLVVNLTLVGNFGGFSMKVTDIYIYILRITLADVQHGLTHDQLIPEQNKTWTCWYAFVHIDIAALSVSLFLLWWKIFAPWYTVVHIVELTVHLKVLTARPENDANTMETETFLIIGIR